LVIVTKGTEAIGPKMKTYRDLIVWQKAMQMVTYIYQLTGDFPKNELYGLTTQIRRCAISIPSNIAEGYGRNSTDDYLRFLNISRASLYELQTQLEISSNLNFLAKVDFEKIYEATREIERMLSSLIIKINRTK
jgi:four helix bundle protein